MFIKNSTLPHDNRHYELFLLGRPYKGEPPTVAGFLLYPDTPAKMETTSREAFCFRPTPQQDGGKGGRITQNAQQEFRWSNSTTLEGTGKTTCVEKREQEEDKQEEKRSQTGSRTPGQGTPEMLSQYQKDFPPPSCLRRRTPAVPQPDNIGINPAFRLEFSTVQREAYPAWSIMNRRYTSRLTEASSGQQNVISK